MDILDNCLNQPTQEPSKQEEPHKQKEKKLVDIQVTNENIALNLMVSFLSLANKRGAFGIDESAKIWECVRLFQKSD
jgi:hypothetical protein